MKNLYVGNLPHRTSEAELRNVFEAQGTIEKITLLTDRDTGRSGVSALSKWPMPVKATRRSRRSTAPTWADGLDHQYGQTGV